MRFASYNDFELLYLIREGSELALNILYDKYQFLIKKIAKRFFSYGDKLNDLIQEGLLVLDRCIKKFDDRKPVLFYTYLCICLNHRFSNLVNKGTYYDEYISFNEAEHHIESNLKGGYSYKYLDIFDELDKKIYYECIIGTLSISGFSKIYNINYNKVYYRSKNIVNELKKILTI